MSKVWKSLILAVVSMVLVGNASFGMATVIEVIPSTSIVNVGDSFSIDVTITDAVDLWLYDLVITFDGSCLDATGITEGDFLSEGGPPLGYPTLPTDLGIYPDGLLEYINSRILSAPGRNGSGTLFTVDFLAHAQGISPINLMLNGLCSSLGPVFPGDPGYPSLAGRNVTVTASSVPEPGTFLLFAIGIIGLGVMKIRDR